MQKMGSYFAPGFAVFAGVFGYVVASRLEAATISALGGVMIGLLGGMPFAALLTFVVVRGQQRHPPEQERLPAPPTYAPPLEMPRYFVQPQPLPWRTETPGRAFLMVGDDGAMREM